MVAINRTFWITAALVVFLDQLSKRLVQKTLIDMPLFGDIKLKYTTNYGAGFSILQHQNALLILVPVLVLIGILWYFRRFPATIHLPLALVFAGTAGNLADRVLLGYVRDFISIWIWPSFNISDIAITAGVIWIVGEELMMKDRK